VRRLVKYAGERYGYGLRRLSRTVKTKARYDGKGGRVYLDSVRLEGKLQSRAMIASWI